MGENYYRYHPLIISICLVGSILAVYWPVYNYDFVRYDDGIYIIHNTNIQSGLNFKSIHWAFTANHASNWHPFTWLSHILDYQLFKDWAGGYHLVNVLFHILNTLILFYVFVRMTGTLWPSAFVAAAFALHPLHVESVAWIAERKDVLSAFFWLLTMWAYSYYVRNLKLKWYLTTFVLFILGLMSKPMLVTVPFVLLLLDYWPFERKISPRLLIEKIPFFICSLASCVITFLVQQSSGAIAEAEVFGLKTRISNAIVSYVMYITKMFWPIRLAIFYPHHGSGLSIIKVAVCALLLLLVSIYFIYRARRYKFLIVGWLWYLGTMIPVIGLIQAGKQAMADRYTYMTLTGLFIIIAWSAKEFIPKWRNKNIILSSLAVITLTASAVTASRQVRHWENSLSLFGHALQVTENNPIMIESYANSLFDVGKLDESIEQFNKLLEVKPDAAESRCNLACALLWTGKTAQAIEHFRLAIQDKPNFALAYNNLASALCKQGRNDEAVEYFEQALRISPNFTEARLTLGMTFSKLRRYNEAIEAFNKVLGLEPDNITAHGYLSIALATVGKTDEAIKEARIFLKAKPNNIEIRRNLGILLEKKGQIAEAIKSYRTILEIDPNETETRQLLEAALKKRQVP